MKEVLAGNVLEIHQRAAPLRDAHDAADGALKAQAVEALTERLRAGNTVGSLSLRDLIDSDLNGPRAGFAAIEVTNLLLADSGERAALADAYKDGVIERFLLSPRGLELIEEEAAEIEADGE